MFDLQFRDIELQGTVAAHRNSRSGTLLNIGGLPAAGGKRIRVDEIEEVFQSASARKKPQ